MVADPPARTTCPPAVSKLYVDACPVPTMLIKPPLVSSLLASTITFIAEPVDPMEPKRFKFMLAVNRTVRVADGETLTAASELTVIEPSVVVLELYAFSVTSRAVSCVCRVVTETVDDDPVAIQTPVVPMNDPAVSVEPAATVSVSAYIFMVIVCCTFR